MAYDVSPYLLLPCRDLPTACKQARHARGLLITPCGACALSDMCKSRKRKQRPSCPNLLKEIRAERLPAFRGAKPLRNRTAGHSSNDRIGDPGLKGEFSSYISRPIMTVASSARLF